MRAAVIPSGLVKGARLRDVLGLSCTNYRVLCDPVDGWVMVRRVDHLPMCVRVSAIGKRTSRWQIKERK